MLSAFLFVPAFATHLVGTVYRYKSSFVNFGYKADKLKVLLSSK